MKLHRLFPLTEQARLLLLVLLGIDRLGLPMPKLDYLLLLGGDDFEEALIELNDKGFILGTPDKFTVNFPKLEKFNVKSVEIAGQKDPPAVLTLLSHFKALHKRLRRGKARSSEREIVQIRYMIRKYDPNEIKPLMEQFFREPLIKARPGNLNIQDFFLWAVKKLDKKASK